ncbi:hypothetical protein Bca101_022142 [Brassica carinata]
MMIGGDVASLGSQAVTKIHRIFDWAKKSNKGLLLFIDEADVSLCERNIVYMSEAQRSALNTLLFRTGDQSRDSVLVLATNSLEISIVRLQTGSMRSLSSHFQLSQKITVEEDLTDKVIGLCVGFSAFKEIVEYKVEEHH